MTPHQQKLRQLIDRLSDKTEEGSLAWRVSGDDKSAQTVFNSAIVEIREDFDSEGQDAIRILIYDKEGGIRSSFDDTALIYQDLGGAKVFYYVEMKSLFEAALRSARGEDQILNKLLSELGDDDVPD